MTLKGEMSTLQIVVGLVILIVVALMLITITLRETERGVGGLSGEVSGEGGAISKIGEVIRGIDTDVSSPAGTPAQQQQAQQPAGQQQEAQQPAEGESGGFGIEIE